MANERARALRRNRTSAERKLWWQLRALKPLDFKFRQQAPIDRTVVDFVCLAERLIIEVDGATHGTPEEQAADERRAAYLSGQGFRVLRVGNGDVYDNIEGVMDFIVQALETRSQITPTPDPSPRRAVGSPSARRGGEFRR